MKISDQEFEEILKSFEQAGIKERKEGEFDKFDYAKKRGMTPKMADARLRVYVAEGKLDTALRFDTFTRRIVRCYWLVAK